MIKMRITFCKFFNSNTQRERGGGGLQLYKLIILHCIRKAALCVWVTVRKWDIRLDIVDWCLIHQIDACYIEHRSILLIEDNSL